MGRGLVGHLLRLRSGVQALVGRAAIDRVHAPSNCCECSCTLSLCCLPAAAAVAQAVPQASQQGRCEPVASVARRLARRAASNRPRAAAARAARTHSTIAATTAPAALKTALQARLRIHLLLARTSTTRAIRTLAPHRVPLLSKVPAHKLAARRRASRRHRCGAVRDT